jgi:hypothetical protein
MNDRQIAQGLGWFSIGLGATQLVAPKWLSRRIGVRSHGPGMRTLGVRELSAGIGILRQKNPAPFVWGRVFGDLMDLALLRRAFRRAYVHSSARRRLGWTLAVVLGATAIDAIMARRLSA